VNEKVSCGWSAFVEDVETFFGKYNKAVKNLLSSLRDIGASMSIELHFFHNLLNHFPEKLGGLSDEKRERFHQDISGNTIRREIGRCRSS